MDVAYQTVSFFYYLSLIVWLGGIITIGFLVAPAIFQTIPSRTEAGKVISPIHRRFQVVQLASMVVLLISSSIILRVWQNMNNVVVVRYLFIFAMVVLAVFHGTIVSRRLRLLRGQITSFDDRESQDPRRKEFTSWHRISVLVNFAILLAGLVVLFLS